MSLPLAFFLGVWGAGAQVTLNVTNSVGVAAPLTGICLNSTNVMGTSLTGIAFFRRSDLVLVGGGGTTTSTVVDAGSTPTPNETYFELDSGGVREVRLSNLTTKAIYNTSGFDIIAISSAFALNGTNYFATLSGSDYGIRLFNMAANTHSAPIATNTLASPTGFDVYFRLNAPPALSNLQFVVCNDTRIRDFNPARGETNNYFSSAGWGLRDIVIATDTKQIFMATKLDDFSGEIDRAAYPVATETNHAPEVAAAFGPVVARVGAAFSVTVPPGTFSDYNPDQPLTLALPGLPPGLAWDATNRTLSGTPAVGGVFPLLLIATDNGTPPLAVTNAFELVVEPAIVTASVASTNRLYGQANPVFAVTASGLLPGDGVAVTASTVAAANSPLGNYPITLALTGSAATNYVLQATNGVLTVGKAALSVTVASKSRVYGAANPVFSGTISGQQNGDSLAGSYGTAATTNSPPGTYPITITSWNDPGGRLGNYNVATNEGTLTITPAMLLVKAEDKARPYGATNPVLTAVFSGFVNGEVLGTSDVTGAPGLSTTADTNSVVGAYVIAAAVGSLASGNYSFASRDGELTVGVATVTASVASTNRPYGQANPVFAVTAAGLLGSDGVAVVAGTVAVTNSPLGNYPITLALTGGAATNYVLQATNGVLTVTANGPPGLRLLGLVDGTMRFTAAGEPGAVVRVEVSEDLVNWSAWQVFAVTNEAAVTFSPAAGGGVRFYRLVYQE